MEIVMMLSKVYPFILCALKRLQNGINVIIQSETPFVLLEFSSFASVTLCTFTYLYFGKEKKTDNSQVTCC